MQPLQNCHETFINECHNCLLKEKEKNKLLGKDHLIEFLKSHPNSIGLFNTAGKFTFHFKQLKIDYDLIDSSLEIDANFIIEILQPKEPSACKVLVSELIERKKWDLLNNVISSLPKHIAERFNLIKDEPYGRYNLRGITTCQLKSLIIAMPSMNWSIHMGDPGNYENIYPLKTSNEINLYHYVKTNSGQWIKEELNKLFQKVYEIFYFTSLQGLKVSVVKNIVKDIFTTEYPILSSAPEVYKLFNSYRIQAQKDLHLKIFRLAFREFRQNNGLCEKKYSLKQKKEITEMFFESIPFKKFSLENDNDKNEMFYNFVSERSLIYVSEEWRKFIKIVGQDQNINKPIFTKTRIKSAFKEAFGEHPFAEANF